MDEPVANLDPKARTEFFDLLMELKKKGKAIFISSHVLAELDRYADSATILDGGKIIYSGDKHTLIKKFVSYQYEVATNNDKLAHKYFLKKHIKYRKSNARDITVVDFHNDANAYACQKELIRKGIVFERFLKIEPSLDQVYNKLIVKGSVDTQEE
jgi:ABC-2 type transport system ATP-binding protein